MPQPPLSKPLIRPLRAFAFDPGMANQLQTYQMNEISIPVCWEDELLPGPVGEYLEVIDIDPASERAYLPVDLNNPYILAQAGLSPSEGNPQFHQQMVYAVAMRVIEHFEKAIGRCALWSYRRYPVSDNKRLTPIEQWKLEYVPRLRLYPHALREGNAYYSPAKKSILFGYFAAHAENVEKNLPSGTVYTCLSHDIVAHEMTHALLDGLHPRLSEGSNVDVLALHEAFADIVAIFQHFTYPEVLKHQISKTRGDLARQNLLAQLARQFGEALGTRGSLRDALGHTDPTTGDWIPHQPSESDYERDEEPHARGALLVAAIFDGFLSIYQNRIADLLRIATQGSGVLPEGELHPDLVDRLSKEASRVAGHVLRMCIRAWDYVPPVDVNFGDYLRALITADYDLVMDDDRGYRLAMIEAFRKRGIYPRDVHSLGQDSLRWLSTEPSFPDFLPILDNLKLEWDLNADRLQVYLQMRYNCGLVHDYICGDFNTMAKRRLLFALRDSHKSLELYNHEKCLYFTEENLAAIGIQMSQDAALTIRRRKQYPLLEVHSVRPARRIGPDGQQQLDIIIELMQSRTGYFDPEEQEEADRSGNDFEPSDEQERFTFRGGCTLVVDAQSGKVRYAIRKDIASSSRLARQRGFLKGESTNSLAATYFSSLHESGDREPFAVAHREI